MKWWGCDVDATNQFASYTPEYGGYIDLGEDTGTEWIGRHLHGATMIKAFNAMFAQYIAPDPPPVVAHLLGYSHNCTQRHAQPAAQPWSRYVTPFS
jgi:predicted dinucleotide-binding enzyme